MTREWLSEIFLMVVALAELRMFLEFPGWSAWISPDFCDAARCDFLIGSVYILGGCFMGWRALALSVGAAFSGGCAGCSRHSKRRVPSGMQLARAVLPGVLRFSPRLLTCSSLSRVFQYKMESTYGEPDEMNGDAEIFHTVPSPTPTRSSLGAFGQFLPAALHHRVLPWRRGGFSPRGAVRRWRGCVSLVRSPVFLIVSAPVSELLICRLSVGELIPVGTVVALHGQSYREISSGPLAKSYGWRGAREVALKPPTGMKLSGKESIFLAREFVPRRRTGRGGCLHCSDQIAILPVVVWPKTDRACAGACACLVVGSRT